MRTYVAGIGLSGPGLGGPGLGDAGSDESGLGWEYSRPILAGAAPWTDTPAVAPPPALLPANERRRAGLPARLALAVAEAAVRMAGLECSAVRGVFGSANGEGALLHDLLEALAEDRAVSPTQFHNSVHNAVAGYWAMAARSRQPMTCLGAHADTFAATLLKALAEVAAERAPVLMCVYDVPMPEPLAAKQPTLGAFACALVLTPEPAGALAELCVSWSERPPPPAPSGQAGLPPGLLALSQGNAAARSLPLLRAIAARRRTQLGFGLRDGTVLVGVEPCSTAPPSPG